VRNILWGQVVLGVIEAVDHRPGSRPRCICSWDSALLMSAPDRPTSAS